MNKDELHLCNKTYHRYERWASKPLGNEGIHSKMIKYLLFHYVKESESKFFKLGV